MRERRSILERKQEIRAKRLAEGLEELWVEDKTGDSEQSLNRALHEVFDQR